MAVLVGLAVLTTAVVAKVGPFVSLSFSLCEVIHLVTTEAEVQALAKKMLTLDTAKLPPTPQILVFSFIDRHLKICIYGFVVVLVFLVFFLKVLWIILIHLITTEQ